ncbi:MAG: hypothetical protein FWC64_00420 [Treponema sp.]|nr:hypothetical protein [Treponema sp.]
MAETLAEALARPQATPQELWAILQENAAQQKETDRLLKETRKQIDRNNKIVGELGNSFGEIVEHLVAPGIQERFADMGLHFDNLSPNVRMMENKKTIAEIDLLLGNREILMAVEVKSKPHINDIEVHENRLERLREWYDQRGDHRKLYGTLAGAVFGEAEKAAAINAGFYVIIQTGDTMKIETPKGFTPREW